ncbi:hypothetical protein, partial [Flavobacterium laiguense]
MKTFLPKSGFLTIVFFIANLVFANASFGQTVTLDQADLDYAPGETVSITGTGWQPNEVINLQVDHLTEPIPDHGTPNPHLPWTIVADSFGNFAAEWFVTEYELGSNLLLIADGIESGFTYEVFFTDATATQIVSLTPSGGICGGNITTSATLQYKSGNNWLNPGSGLTIVFTLGANTVNEITNSSGVATATLAVSGNPNSLVANYNGPGGNGYSSSNSSIGFVTTGIVTPSVSIAITSGVNPTCSGSSVTFTATPTNGGVASYQWKKGTTNVGTNSATYTDDGVTAGNITCVMTSNLTCVTSATATSNAITLNVSTANIPTITPSAPTNFCAGGSVSLTSTAGTSYLWSTGETTQSITVSSTGSYTVRIENANGCESASSLATAVTVNPLPTTVTVIGGGTYCGNTTITASNGSSGTIYFQDTTSGGTSSTTLSSSQLITTSGTYYFRARSASGCWGPEGSASVTINQIPIATINTGNTAICQGDNVTLSITLTGTGTISGILNDGTPFSGLAGTISIVKTPSVETTYSIASLSNGICAGTFSGSTAVTFKGKYTANAGNDQTICPQGTASVSGSVTGNPSATVWTTSGTGVFTNANVLSTVYTPSAADKALGSVILTLTTSGTGTCDGVDNMVLTVEDKVAAVAIAQAVTVQLDNLGAGSVTAAQVDNGSNDACGIQSLSVSPNTFTCANVGANTVTLTVTDNNGNVSTTTATVTVKDEVLPVATAKNITVQLDATGNVSIAEDAVNDGSSDACGGLTYDTDKTSFNCSNVGANPVVLTVTDANGNSSAANAVVTVEDKVAPVATAKNITVQLDATGNVS